MTLRSFMLHFPPVPSPLALPILVLVLFVVLALLLLLALGFEHRARLAELRQDQRKQARRVEQRLTTDRACVLRDMSHGPEKHELDAPTSDDFA